MTIEIREFTVADTRTYIDLRAESLQDSPQAYLTVADEFSKRTVEFSERRIRTNFESADNLMLGAFIENKAVGMMTLVRLSHPRLSHIGQVVAVYVSPSQRGQGLAGRLLDQLIQHANSRDSIEQMRLGVNTKQTAAVNLYQSRGFTVYGTEPRALKKNNTYHDEHLMIKLLDQPTQ